MNDVRQKLNKLGLTPWQQVLVVAGLCVALLGGGTSLLMIAGDHEPATIALGVIFTLVGIAAAFVALSLYLGAKAAIKVRA